MPTAWLEAPHPSLPQNTGPQVVPPETPRNVATSVGSLVFRPQFGVKFDQPDFFILRTGLNLEVVSLPSLRCIFASSSLRIEVLVSQI
jgi:hypothetical protein